MNTHKRSASVGGSPHQGAQHTEHTILVQKTEDGFGLTLNEMGRIAAVDPGSPAAVAGLQKFDRISHVDGVPLSSSISLSHCIVGKEEVLFGVERPPMSLHREIAAKENRLSPVARAATVEPGRRPISGSGPPRHKRNSSDPPSALAVRSLALALSEATGWGTPAAASPAAASPAAASAFADDESVSETNSEAGSAKKRSAAARLFRRPPRPEPVAIKAELSADHLAAQPQGSPSTFEHV
tara:strand:+ start:316 stop:1035 length:720 start_codon:yes stop_codon:yes gene_type:complete